jgi:REP element-mobilizing transposase RayT
VIVPGGIYHVTTRGNNRRPVFTKDEDFEAWLRELARVVLGRCWLVFAYCIMTTHFHLVLQAPEGDLSAGIRELNWRYARLWNLRHRSEDHVWGKRFSSTYIEDESHLPAAIRYVDLNPVEAGICDDPADYRWSSHAACMGLVLPPRFLALGATLELFGSSPARARRVYADYVSLEHVPVPGERTGLERMLAQGDKVR